MSSRKTKVRLDTCGCVFVYNSDMPDISLHQYLEKCEDHKDLNDQDAFDAAIQKSRSINLGVENGDGL